MDQHVVKVSPLSFNAEQLRLFVEFAPAPIAIVDREMRYLVVSRRWLADYHLSGQQVIGRCHYEVFPEIPERWKAIHRRCLAGAVESCEEDSFQRKDGSIDWLRWAVHPWRRDDGTIGGLTLYTEVITERKQGQLALEESERKFRAMVEHAADLIIAVDATGRIIYASPSVFKITGFAQEEILGRNLMDLTHAEDVPIARESFENLLRNPQEPCHKEIRWVHRDGSDILLDSVATNELETPPLNAVVINARDITQARKAEQEMRDSEARFRAIIEQSISGACIIDASGKFVYVNPRLLSILGFGSDTDVVGYPVAKIIAPESRDIVNRNLKERFAGKERSIRYSFEAIRRDGSRITLGAHGTLGTYRDQPVVIATVQDVTELRRAEEEIQRTIGKLRRAVQGTVEVIATIGEMRDPYTQGHQHRVGDLAAAIATEMGLSEPVVEGVRIAGYVHDVGKLGIPAEILVKPSKLTKLEFDLVKQHSQFGYDILSRVDFPWPVAEATWQHHERLDGSGYPRGLKGDEIIPEARILAVADTVEAMSSHRPYRPGVGTELALAEIERHRGSLYDAAAVDACLHLFRDKDYRIHDG